MTREVTTDWILATTNAGKLAEYRELLSDAPLELRALDPESFDAPDETGLSFIENALIKARHASARSGCPAIADDSGLCVAALSGAPGVRSARYAGPEASDSDNVEKLLRELESVDQENRQAEFHCVIVALAAPEDPAPMIATGSWPGWISDSPRGRHGFGYDPVFFDAELGLTAAELPPETKNSVSHRGRACRELKRLLARTSG